MLTIAVELLAGFLPVAASDAPLPKVCGRARQHIVAADVLTIERLVQDRRVPWLLRVIVAEQVAPTFVLVDAYLPPSSTSAKLRRGIGFRLDKSADGENASGGGWRVTPKSFEYAQVATTREPARSGCDTPHGWGAPFEVEGIVSDADIGAIVQLVQSGPRRSAATSHADGSLSLEAWKIEGRNQILTVTARETGIVEVRTESGPGAGQLIELKKTDKDWEVVLGGQSKPAINRHLKTGH